MSDGSESGGGSLREFVQARYTELLRTAYLLTGSTHEAEDLVQSALLRMMRRWDGIDDPLAYARRTVVNLYVKSLRRRARELITAQPPEPDVQQSTDRVAERSALWPALRSLPARSRAVIVLRYWLDMSEAVTAQVLGCSIGTVKSTSSRALARLRESTVVMLERGGSR